MQVDPRGQRLAAAITTVVLVVVLVTGSWGLLAAQAVVFAVAAILGMRYAPYGLVFKSLVRPRIGPRRVSPPWLRPATPGELEAEAPPRFAQGVGLGFALVGVTGYLLGIEWLGIGATAFALAAAFLNAAFGFCLGCEMYLLIRRLFSKSIPKNRSDREVPV